MLCQNTSWSEFAFHPLSIIRNTLNKSNYKQKWASFCSVLTGIGFQIWNCHHWHRKGKSYVNWWLKINEYTQNLFFQEKDINLHRIFSSSRQRVVLLTVEWVPLPSRGGPCCKPAQAGEGREGWVVGCWVSLLTSTHPAGSEAASPTWLALQTTSQLKQSAHQKVMATKEKSHKSTHSFTWKLRAKVHMRTVFLILHNGLYTCARIFLSFQV